FFSSRRRHTRFSRDWSSDVCSSDLKYLEEGSLSAEELRQGLAGAVKSGEVVPVLCGSAAKGIGLAQLLQAIGTLLPSPLEAEPQPTVAEGGEPVAPGDGPLAAYVFKTMADPYVDRKSTRLNSSHVKSSYAVFCLK